jgi:radical SAM superfamily enzyme with C-terminal helix-hairpin-helix motif
MQVERVALVDGYVDEPTCLGVPPYVSIYPRYIAGAIWSRIPKAEIVYNTIDQIRESFTSAQQAWSKTDLIILIAGMIVPGKYVGGTPISVREARELFSVSELEDIPKMLVGPWARFGCGIEGGKLALSSDVLSPPFDYIVHGDSELVISQALETNLETVDLDLTRESAHEIEEFVRRGVSIVTQHPGYSRMHIICEIESYRGCPRFMTGGCSFCVEPSYGPPQQRDARDIAGEIQALYEQGVRAFRIGHQADLFTYGSKEMSEVEFPTPNPDAIEELFSKTRTGAPELDVLHIDNVNPGTIARHPEVSKKVAKTIMKYHTPGDVAAFGVESTDPEVIHRNNLKADVEEVVEAIRILNEVGGTRQSWGLPHLLPGINLLYGLPGESKRTLEHNMDFLNHILQEGLIVRRINVRQVIGLPATGFKQDEKLKIKRNQFFKHRAEIREKIDIEMIKRVAPRGTVIRSVFADGITGNSYLLRPLGTYPLLCHMPMGSNGSAPKDVFVVDHGPRSLTVLPYPFKVRQASLAQWKKVSGIGAKRAARTKTADPITNVDQLQTALDTKLPDWFSRTLDFE